jgi:CRISPR-associated protein Csc1
MQILRCDLTLLENTFFSSREVGNFYQTEPVIGNYALAYALGLAVAPYENRGQIRYVEDLAPLNQQGIYVTPAQIVGQARFKIEQFNAMTDSYWYAMGNNALITKPDGWDAEQSGSAWYVVERATGRRKKIGTSNYPQIGRIKMLGIGNQARFYLLYAGEQPRIPSYIRLGKWNSKARVMAQPVTFQTVQRERATGTPLLNPVDLAQTTHLQTFDMIGIHPVPLIRNAVSSGSFYQLADKEQTLLPVDMRFGVAEAYHGR